ncbi:hypothetical protein L1987_18217 [Smallanthus sonchifolius]|uniref:Uncharacterized protein n=1 Tax=Smallanthus sonchifolius TaxID=185202 RepID=A0ACB9J2K7_9ASTR|nr:hypothetical protein L1987_18217 [Smallanthus sonchifolius]
MVLNRSSLDCFYFCVLSETNAYDEAASKVAGSSSETTIQQFLDMGGGSWDRKIVIRALRAAYNNPERAVDYLYSGIPEQAEVTSVAQPTAPQSRLIFHHSSSAGGALGFLRNNQQFQAFRSMVQANPEMLQLEAMGFDRSMALEVFIACNKNEELAANYLLDYMHEFEDCYQGS